MTITTKAITVKPLTTDAEEIGLDVARYVSHVRAAAAAQAEYEGHAQALANLHAAQRECEVLMARALDSVVLFVGEARDQVSLLQNIHRLSPERIASVIGVPACFDEGYAGVHDELADIGRRARG